MTDTEQAIAEQLRNADEATLESFATRVARHIETANWRPIIREVVLIREMEKTIMGRDGIARTLLGLLRSSGINLRVSDTGQLIATPKAGKVLDSVLADMIRVCRWDLIREIEAEKPANGKNGHVSVSTDTPVGLRKP